MPKRHCFSADAEIFELKDEELIPAANYHRRFRRQAEDGSAPAPAPDPEAAPSPADAPAPAPAPAPAGPPPGPPAFVPEAPSGPPAGASPGAPANKTEEEDEGSGEIEPKLVVDEGAGPAVGEYEARVRWTGF